MIQLECRASTGTGLSTVYRDNTPVLTRVMLDKSDPVDAF